MTAKKSAAKPAPKPKGKARDVAKPQPTGTLTEACARIIGEAHEPLSVADVTSKLLAGGWRKTEYQVGVELAAMVPAHASRHGERFWTPADVADGALPPAAFRDDPGAITAREAAGPDRCRLTSAPTLPVKSLAELIAEAPRKVKRVLDAITPEGRASLETARTTLAASLDAAIGNVKSTTAALNSVNRTLRSGKVAREVSTVTVPDHARKLLVTYDVTGPEPVEVSTKKLPRKYGAAPAEQMALDLGGGK